MILPDRETPTTLAAFNSAGDGVGLGGGGAAELEAGLALVEVARGGSV